MLLLTSWTAVAQHKEVDEEKFTKPIHSITLMLGHAFIPNSFSENTNDLLITPSYGFNYDYQPIEKWGVGIHTDIILQQFKVEQNGSNEEIIRENPVSVAGLLFFKPHHQWKILAGFGFELEKHKTFQLIRFGLEYGIEISNHWELGFSIENDYKISGYNNLLLGVNFTKKLSKHN